ncbi:hypothetical protein HYW76_03395 [Candidatus Pacearchaeota archaeon]|nr:hypothetical protein [Candidatus Pacearchaeota archaeon]
MNDKRLLPLVTAETGKGLSADISQNQDWESKLIAKLVEEDPDDNNPRIVEALSNLMGYAKTVSERRYALTAGLLVYKLLESQADADKMKREFE